MHRPGHKSWPFTSLKRGSFGAILADPPWTFSTHSDKGLAKSAAAHYPVMADADIASLPVSALAAPDCVMFLWAVWPRVDFALACLASWGFTVKTGGTWVKRSRAGGLRIGTGYWFRNACDPWFLATRGQPRAILNDVPNVIEAYPRQHSRKPPEARRILERLTPGAERIELFAREKWAGPGNRVWGNETDKFARAA